MRIGIATWYKENYGSILQAFAMSQFLKNMGHDPVFLQFDSSGGFVSKMVSRIGILGVKRAFAQYIAVAKGRLAVRPYRKALDIRSGAMERFIEENLAVTERIYSRGNYGECLQEADIFLCGSDQIWNPAITCYSPFFWLSFVPKDVPKISYAPSMGMPKLRAEDKSFVVSQLNTFLEVSVRESTTADMLNELEGLDKRVEVVVDPTLLLSKKHWEALCNSSSVLKEDDEYAFAYLLRGNSEQRAFCESIARSRGLKLVVYPCLEAVPQGVDVRSWGDEKIFDDSPADFLARIRGASLVITDSFHCTLFSILFHRDFYVLRKTFDTASQATRIDEILAIAGLDARILDHLEMPRMESDFSVAEARISTHACMSREFLCGAISNAEREAGGQQKSSPCPANPKRGILNSSDLR